MGRYHVPLSAGRSSALTQGQATTVETVVHMCIDAAVMTGGAYLLVLLGWPLWAMFIAALLTAVCVSLFNVYIISPTLQPTV
jgi:hypothetical protein